MKRLKFVFAIILLWTTPFLIAWKGETITPDGSTPFTGNIVLQDHSLGYDGTGLSFDSGGTATLTGGLILGNESVTCGDGTNTCAYSAAVHSSYYTSDDDGDGADVVTVTDGTAGQVRRFVLKTDGGDDIEITPSNFANGTKITLDTAGQSVTLEFDGTNWFMVSTYGGTVS